MYWYTFDPLCVRRKLLSSRIGVLPKRIGNRRPPTDMPPLPLVLSTRRIHLATSCLRLVTRRCLSAGTSPLICLSFTGWFSHHILSRCHLKCPSLTPAFIDTGWLLRLISLCCFRLPSSRQHRRLLMRWQLTSRLPLVRPNWLHVCLT
jgi:hypothetical protein